MDNLLIEPRKNINNFLLTDWNINKEVARLLHNRLVDPGECLYDWKYVPNPFMLKNMLLVVERLQQAKVKSEKIIIVGDYDADGATSISIMMLGLEKLGFQNVAYVVPNRFVDGYGLTPCLLPKILKHDPQLIVTVDNGIQSCEAVDLLLDAGVDVIITDHHLQGAKLPNALIVNPNQLDCPFPDKNIAGCVVAWYVILALRSHLQNNINVNQLTVYAAIGTIADCVKLSYVNRIFINKGLNLIRKKCLSQGLLALMSLANIDASQIISSDIAFKLAPRLNASGRLDDMSLGVKCLLENDSEVALKIARELCDLNSERQNIQSVMEKQAIQQLVELNTPAVIYDVSWHLGIIGLLASKAKEYAKRPVIAFAWDDNKKCFKGSGRSVPGINLKHILDEISKIDPDLMLNFGGHAMAVGLSVCHDKLEPFKEAFFFVCGKKISSNYHVVDLTHDGDLPLECDFNWFIKLYDEHPFGQGFEEPIYSAYISNVRNVSNKNGHYRLEGKLSHAYPVTAWVFKDINRKEEIVFAENMKVFFQFMYDKSKFVIKIIARQNELGLWLR